MKIKRREVEFKSENPKEMIRADLFTPGEGKGPWPVIIMGGGWCYVKELIMPELWAARCCVTHEKSRAIPKGGAGEGALEAGRLLPHESGGVDPRGPSATEWHAPARS